MSISLEAKLREDLGRGASRRLRRSESIPAIVMGKGQETISISLDEKKLIVAALKEDFYNAGCELVIDGKSVNVKPVAMQRHPVSSRIIHVDFLRV